MTRRAALDGLAHGLELALASVRTLMDEPDPDEWVGQDESPLGRRRHRELAKSGKLAGARKLGATWLVRRREIDAYIDSTGTAPAATTAENDASESADILAFRAPKRGKRRS